MEGPLPCNTFYPHSSEGTRTWLLDSLIRSQAMEENRRGYSVHLSAPGRPQIIFRTTNECYSNEHPKIKFLGIRFLKTALKSQHILAGVVLQNRQEVDFLIPEQGGNWAILNETCCFWVNTSGYVKDSFAVLKKIILGPTGPQRTSWRFLGVATISLWGILLVMGNWELANAPTNPVITVLMLLRSLHVLSIV